MRALLIAVAALAAMAVPRAEVQQPPNAGVPLDQAAVAQPDAGMLLRLAARWTARFDQSLSGLLFRERYSQKMDYLARTGPTRDRLLEANVFLLKLPTARGFVLFRDVYKVDNRAIGDHTQRLEKLLASGTSDDALRHARRLTDASARHNIGRFTRNVNVPTMALDYLAPDRIAGLRPNMAGAETVAGLRTLIVEFEETERPTLVRGIAGGDVPARGRYWIHPTSGAVVRAEVELTGQRTKGRMRVELELHPTLGVWVPKEMTDVWRGEGENVNGFARYDNYKRLAVSTAEIMK